MRREKKYFRSFLLFGFLFWCIYSFPPILGQNQYSSEDGGLIFEDSDRLSKNVYYRWHINKLSKSIKPKYIRFIDFSSNLQGNPQVVIGVLFTYKAPFAKTVKIAGNFSNWESKNMQKNLHDVWYTIIPMGEEFQKDRLLFEYKFNIDGIWDFDRENEITKSDGLGSVYSIFRFPAEYEHIKKNITVRLLPEHLESNEDRKLYEFRIYNPDATTVSLVGNFNHWNPEHDLATKDSDGIWRIRLSLKKGEYLYKFIVDGIWILDNYNPVVILDPVTNIKASYLKVK
jgi:hypothetical protein